MSFIKKIYGQLCILLCPEKAGIYNKKLYITIIETT